ncbi:MAG: TetR/AcrR family transcriptional regulator [Desulfobacteraceae bacterium]|nr:TetR/AcrR family transcriptional regulator [Desulfobacteraceae bacterium]
MGVKERRAMEKQMRRNQILDAARKLLFSQGFENVSISKISKEAQLGVGTIYFYYKNKADIFVALQEEGLAFLFSTIQQIQGKELNPEEKLNEIALAYYNFSQNQQEYFNIINYFLSSPRFFFQEEQKQLIDMSGNKILMVIEDIILQGVEAGFFIEEDPRKFSILFWGTMHGLIHFKKLEHTTLQNENHQLIYQYSVDKLIKSIQ